jgi:aryl-alcohol dehydrogenase-like predicted oxidoreductase
VIAVADEIGCSPAQVAINWIRAQQHRAPIIPIIGARTLDQFRDNLACLDVSLTLEQVQRLDAASAIDLWFPHDFLAADTPRTLIYGDTVDRLDWP